jgi:endonuclease-3 related protein
MAKRTPRPSAITPSALYDLLHGRYGDLEWWPAKGPFEVMVGAVLTQRTSWRNVEKALANLDEAGVTNMWTLLATPAEELEGLVRPSGTYRQKARRLLALFTMVDARGSGSLDAFLDRPIQVMRSDLLSVHGIGPETADSIILYAAGRPTFVVDAYTRRVLERLSIGADGSYDDVARWFTEGLPKDPHLYNNYHAALVELAKGHCRTVPMCDGCPLLPLCPTGKGLD